ncbi:MAG: fatty acyl-AMP ligase [Thermoanaerobaculia bacterium]|nr:fatty acyl-AMP ligase [Thermoanaerobaculia bacterium]
MLQNHLGFSSCRSLTEVLQAHLEHRADKPLFTLLEDGETEAGTCTFAQLDVRARALAALFQARGLTGQRALLVFPTSLDFVVAFFACLYAGVVAVPVTVPTSRKRATFDRLMTVVHDCEPRVALTTAALKPRILELAPDIPGFAGLEWLTPDDAGDELAGEWRDPKVERETLAFLQYTSGSTNFPKGVMVSHGNILHNAAMIRAASGHQPGWVGVSWLPLHHDMGLIGVVLQQTFSGMHSVLMPPLYFLQSPIRWLRAIDRYRSHTCGGPNFAFELCLRRVTPEQCEGFDLSCWRAAFNGAEPIRAETLERFAEKFAPFGFELRNFFSCYGLAEATLLVSGCATGAPPVIKAFDREALGRDTIVPVEASAASTAPPDVAHQVLEHQEGRHVERRPGDREVGNQQPGDRQPGDRQPGESERVESEAQGRVQRLAGSGTLWLDQQVLIVDPSTLERCSPDRVGEIWIAGGSVGQGYWGLPEQSAETFGARLADDGEAGPFLRTGDLGFFFDGELFITGRLKDLIILAGLNYYPQDIEKTVEACHPNVRPEGCAAFSVDKDGEERLVVVAEVRSSDGREETVAAIRRAINESHELRAWAVELIRTGTLPKTTSGKVQRRLCKSLFLEGGLSRIGS